MMNSSPSQSVHNLVLKNQNLTIFLLDNLVLENQTNETIEKKFRACLVSINDSSVERESSEEAWGKGGLMF